MLMGAAIAELLGPFLTAAEIAASRRIMGPDTQLLDDGKYFVVEVDGAFSGCGGWSRRATVYGDASRGRVPAALDPARVRAMYRRADFKDAARADLRVVPE